MTLPLQDKVVVVTGAATGIGYGIAHRLLADGAKVAAFGLDQAALDIAIERLGDPARTAAMVGDLALAGVAEQLLAAVVERFGGIDALVNNAGGGVIIPTLDHTEQTLRTTIDNNLWTTLRTTLAVLPTMVECGGGRIVNIGAESVRNGLTDHAVYNAAKGGVHAFAIGLAREFARHGITVNVVAPSYTRTSELDEAISSGRLPARLGTVVIPDAVDLIPIGRPADVAEVAAAVAYLLRDDSSFITGQVLSVNGGSSMS